MPTLTADPTSIIRVNPKNLTFNEALFQKMPQLNDEARDLLLADIAARGVTVPVEVTPEGVVVDGHNRVRLAIEAGVEDIPAIVKSFGSDEEATAHVFAVNLQRRHLNQTDKRKLVKEFLALDPYKSNRQVADELGGAVTDKTVAAVREEAESKGEIEKSTTRKGKDGKTRSASGTKSRASKGAGERRKLDGQKMAASSIRMGMDEATRLIAKNEGFNPALMVDLMTAKQKEKLTESLTSTLPFFIELAARLGIDGYEFEDEDEAPSVEADATQDAEQDKGDAPF